MSWAKSHLKPAGPFSLAWLLTASLAQLLALGWSHNITKLLLLIYVIDNDTAY